ncbi:MAG: cupin domain-containing protein [Aridibacter famidurans]|nr:cupin domain-containing protein [Aridibacter famidurans]
MSNKDDRFPADPEIRFTIDCDDLDFALEGFIEKQGYRLYSIFPADRPREAIVEREGAYVKLEKVRDADPETDDEAPLDEIVVNRPGDSEWHEGRAGMQYRDLLPGRAGGRLIASHIRIPEGGPVPDYVHFHKVDFQVIYCLSGSCKLVYESQGEPFEFSAGGCVLQPPGIRHRVLECSDGFEVLELSSPAEHATYADHDLELPNGPSETEKEFNGQRFHKHEAKDETVGVSNLGLEAVSDGKILGNLVRSNGSGLREMIADASDAFFVYVIAGNVEITRAGSEPETLAAGSSLFVPPYAQPDLGAAEATALVFRLKF